jgi:hypothetical protein
MREGMDRFLALSCLALCAGVSPAASQDASEPTVLDLIDNRTSLAASYRLDLSSAGSPGFVVNASPKEIFEPGNLKDFAIDIANFIENGRLKPGVAVNMQPFWQFNRHTTIEQYSGVNLDGSENAGGFRPWQRILARTQIGLAVIEGANEATQEGVRVGVGAVTELFDGPDPRNVALAMCHIAAWGRFAKKNREDVARRALEYIVAHGGDIDEVTDNLAAELAEQLTLGDYDQAVAACNETEKRRVENSPSWIVGGGFAASSDDASLGALQYSGASFWSSSTLPFAENRSFQLFAKADLDRKLTGAGGISANGNAFHGAAALAFSDPGTWKLDATASYHWQDADFDALDDAYFQFSVGGAFKVRDGVWLEGAFGTRTGADHRDESFSSLKLKFDVGEPAARFLGN